MTNLNVTALQKPGTAHVRQVTRAAARIVALVLRPLAEAYRARRDAGHLMGLNDDLLKDIGIARSEIDFIVGTGRHNGHCKWG
jgi:uncharacterized protein YjiS (DUF1127 family)